MPDASLHDTSQREADQPALSGTAVDNAAELDTLLAEPLTSMAWQAGRADRALADSGQPTQLGAADGGSSGGIAQHAAPAAQPLSTLHSSAESVHQQGDVPSPETGAAAAAAAVSREEQAVMLPQPIVPLEQPVAPLEQPAVPLGQPAAPVEQPAVPLQQALALVEPQQRQAAAALNDEPMTFEELVGLRGPIRLLFENAGTVIFSSALFMAAALWAPFMWGRITIRAIAMLQTACKLTVLPAAAMHLLLKNYQVWSQAAFSSQPCTGVSYQDTRACCLVCQSCQSSRQQKVCSFQKETGKLH